MTTDVARLAAAVFPLPVPPGVQRLADEHHHAKLLADDLGIHEIATEMARVTAFSYPQCVDRLAMGYGPGWDEQVAAMKRACGLREISDGREQQ